jgi:hypothetical protein
VGGCVKPPWTYTADRVQRILELAGHATAREIAGMVGVTLPSLKGWAKTNGVSFAMPPGTSRCAIYNQLRQRAHQLGLRLSMQRNRVSLWVSVREDMSMAEARAFLAHKNRRRRFQVTEDAFLKAGPSMMSRVPKIKVRRAA